MTKVEGVVEDAQVIAKDVETLAGDAETLAKTATEAISQIDGVMDQIDEVIPTLDKATKDISDVAASLNEEGLPKLYDNLDSLNRIDIESLNESIKSLHNVVEPLARLFGM